jgi:rod shape determining protein RodA
MGRGFLEGTQSQLNFLPMGHTDFIFAVFAEEWGFLGVILLLGLYLTLILWGVEVAYKAKDPLGSLIAGGCVAILVFYLAINIGMTLGVTPVVGLPLPLMSYGGSSMLTTMATLGLIMNVKMRRFMLFY